MVHFKSNLEKILVIFWVCISLNRALADTDDFDKCLMDMEKLFGLETPPLDCAKIAIKDLLYDDLNSNKDVVAYTDSLKLNSVFKDTIEQKQFCLKRALDMVMPPKSQRINSGIIMPPQELVPKAGILMTPNAPTTKTELEIFDHLQQYISNADGEIIEAISSKCIEEIEIFGDDKDLIEIIGNAIDYHKLGTEEPKDNDGFFKYFVHKPGSHGDAYMNHIVNSLLIKGNVGEPKKFCEWIYSQRNFFGRNP